MHSPKNKRVLWPLTFAVTTLLASCGGPRLPSPNDGLVTLTLRAPFAARDASGVRPQGLPTDAGGASAVRDVRVRVFTSDGSLVKFDAQRHADPNGTVDHLDLTPSAASANVGLAPGSYTFQAAGASDSANGVLLAFGRLERQSVTANGAVTLKLQTLIGDGAVALTSALPMNAVVPGQTFDVLLSVKTPDANGARYTVPLDDFQVEYALDANLGHVKASGKLGARVTAAATPSGATFTLGATVTGLGAADAETAASKTFGATFALPFLSGTGVKVDFDAPDLGVDTPQVAGGSVLVSGSSFDDVGLSRLEVFDGPVLVASTDDAAGAAKVTFDVDDAGHLTNRWSAAWTNPESGAHALTVIATDTSGSETRREVGATIGGASGGGSGGGSSGSVSPAPDYSASVGNVISASGGGTLATVGADGAKYTLTFPPNALAEDTQITMTPLASIGGLPFGGPLAGAVKLEPDGLQLYQYATLTISPAAPLAAGEISPFSFRGPGVDLDVPALGADTTLQRYTLKLSHFSGYGVASGTDAERAALAARAAQYGTEAVASEIRDLLNRERLAALADQPGDPQFREKLDALMNRMYDENVAPYLADASSNCTIGRSLVPSFLNFVRQAELIGGGHDAQEQAAMDAVRGSVQACLREQTQPCVTPTLTALLELTRTVRQAALLGVSDEGAMGASTCGWKGKLERDVHTTWNKHENNWTETLQRDQSLEIELTLPTASEMIDILAGRGTHANQTFASYSSHHELNVSVSGPEEDRDWTGRIICSETYTRFQGDKSVEEGESHESAGGAVQFRDGKWIVNFGGPTIFTQDTRTLSIIESYPCHTAQDVNSVQTTARPSSEGVGLYAEVSGDANTTALHGTSKGPEDGGDTTDVVTYDLTLLRR
ncbi:hypothetical protein [Deinococcus yavapaiensis]|uniref:Uncharacterized protein n=1 Tax=Deinococcus yavapaiensis KR-236 TaxID=694435 RepID=A0A318S3T8_9DEIO|nr:hypothetical protein [Deinococcus yavapaiensis]PYE52720.1 hypothetical protein DES52_11241 [Deinococcus yavapaiensis KR-236]